MTMNYRILHKTMYVIEESSSAGSSKVYLVYDIMIKKNGCLEYEMCSGLSSGYLSLCLYACVCVVASLSFMNDYATSTKVMKTTSSCLF